MLLCIACGGRCDREQFTLTGHTGAVYAVSISPDGKQVLSGSRDKTAQTVRLRDSETGLLRNVLPSPHRLGLSEASAPAEVSNVRQRCMNFSEGHHDPSEKIHFGLQAAPKSLH